MTLTAAEQPVINVGLFLVSDGSLSWSRQLHSDVDKGDGQVRYVLKGDGAMSIFTIDENTGDIHATKRLDRELQAYYTLQAQARDRTSDLPVEPESQFVIKVQDINDNEPKFPDGPYVARVAEMSPVGAFGRLRQNLFTETTLRSTYQTVLAFVGCGQNTGPSFFFFVWYYF